jgi:hypothetical protein
MTRWQRFYKAIGGLGPDDPHESSRQALRLSTPVLREFHGPTEIARFLMWLGFLAYDPGIPDYRAGFFYCMKWQWRFWKGPYHDYIVAGAPIGSLDRSKAKWLRVPAPWTDRY